MRWMLMLALPIALLGCTKSPPLGEVQKKAFAAQASAGQRPDGASHLNADEVRAILGTSSATPTNTATKASNSAGQSKTPLTGTTAP